MTIQKLSRLLLAREGLKKQVNKAQMDEILGHISDMHFEEIEEFGGSVLPSMFYANGARRAKKPKAQPKFSLKTKTKRKKAVK